MKLIKNWNLLEKKMQIAITLDTILNCNFYIGIWLKFWNVRDKIEITTLFLFFEKKRNYSKKLSLWKIPNIGIVSFQNEKLKQKGLKS